jgi:hypothetical protein
VRGTAVSRRRCEILAKFGISTIVLPSVTAMTPSGRAWVQSRLGFRHGVFLEGRHGQELPHSLPGFHPNRRAPLSMKAELAGKRRQGRQKKFNSS